MLGLRLPWGGGPILVGGTGEKGGGENAELSLEKSPFCAMDVGVAAFAGVVPAGLGDGRLVAGANGDGMATGDEAAMFTSLAIALPPSCWYGAEEGLEACAMANGARGSGASTDRKALLSPI